MRYPPAVTHTLTASRVYRLIGCVIAMILIACIAYSMPAINYISFKFTALMLLSSVAAFFLLRDAWAQPRGQLHYAQGAWQWLRDGVETEGTCTPYFDLHGYMLVGFKAHSNDNKLFSKKTQWFHLEAKCKDSLAGRLAWLALRRAVHSPLSTANVDELALEPAAQVQRHEKRVA